MPNSTRLWKLLKIAEFRTPTPQDVLQKDTKILKLPSVRNCSTLAMTNKLVVIINSLKVPKIKKILLYEMKFLVPNYSCLQNPSLGGYRPCSSVLNWVCWNPPTPLEQNSWVRQCASSPPFMRLLFCCLSVVKTYLHEVRCKAVSEGLFRMARRFKVNCSNAVLDLMFTGPCIIVIVEE